MKASRIASFPSRYASVLPHSCLRNASWDAWPFTGLVVGGAWLALVYAAAVRLTRGGDEKAVARVAGKLARLAALSLVLGLLVLAVHILVTD